MIRARGHRSQTWGLPVALVVGIGVGLAAGLIVSWGIWPVEYVDVAPDSLRPAHRDEYLVLIGQSYALDGNLALAQARLTGLGELEEMGAQVATLAERFAFERERIGAIQALTMLAYDLGHQRATLAAYLPGTTPFATWTPWPTATPTPMPTPTTTFTPTSVPTETPTLDPTETPTATPTQTRAVQETITVSPTQTAPSSPQPTRTRTPTPRPTNTAVPTRTPTITPVPEPRFRLEEQRQTCGAVSGQLAVMVLDADGRQMPNVELIVRWEGGDDRFFTGLKPDIGAGYADFAMEKAKTYQVVVVGLESDVAQEIVADVCEGDHLASWEIVFQLDRAPLP